MSKTFTDMTVPELLKYIEEQHGIKLPVKTTKTEALARIKELENDTTPVAAGDSGGNKKEGKLPIAVIVRVHEDDDPRPYVVFTFNGRAYQIEKGHPVRVPYGVYEVMNNAIETLYRTVTAQDGTKQLVGRDKHRHPFSVEEKIYS